METIEAFINPWSCCQPQLVSLVSGIVASPEIQQDQLSAADFGEKSLQKFFADRISSKDVDFFAPIKASKLKTFDKSTHGRQKTKQHLKTASITHDKSIYARLLVIGRSRDIDLKSVLCYPINPVPLPLATADGEICKTNKSVLLQVIESDIEDRFLDASKCVDTALIVDSMAMIQALPAASIPSTFGLLGDLVLKNLLYLAQHYKSSRLDFVIDRYSRQSIKASERVRRTKNTIFHLNITNKDVKVPKQWKSFLSNGANKESLLEFLAIYWETCDLPPAFKLVVAVGSSCRQLISSGNRTEATDLLELACDHEEADTRLIAHAANAAKDHSTIIISSPDTDVAVLCLAHSDICRQFGFLTGVKSKRRLLDIRKCAQYLGSGICKALIGLHAFTGCDSVSSFAGKGKKTVYRLVKTNPECLSTMQQLGECFDMPENIIEKIEKFVCVMYGLDKVGKVNEARYKLFCSSAGSESSMPPCQDTLLQHAMRANYQAAIWKRANMSTISAPTPLQHGWVEKDGQYTVVWNTGPIAPKDVLQSVYCRCVKSKCEDGRCSCKLARLRCTDVCTCKSCENDVVDEEPIIYNEDLDDEWE